MIRFTTSICAAALLAACTTATAPVGGSPTSASASDPLTQIAQFTVMDLQNADALALAAPDAPGCDPGTHDCIAHACYPALTKFVQSIPAVGGQPQTVSGAISAFELARSTRLGVQSAVGSGLPAYLKLGCAALVQDETVFAAKLAAMAGGAAASPTALPAIIP